MNGSAVLLCSRAWTAAEPPEGAVVVADLCDRPEAAADALREAGATRVVVALCRRRPSSELLAALRRAGAEPFGVEAVAGDAGPVALAAARAKLDALPAGERGRPILNRGAVSRRSLLSARGALTHAPVAAVDGRACVESRSCGLCIGECPVQAIGAGSGTPVIDVSACTACGRCVGRCPHGALRIAGASARQVEAQLEALIPGVDGIVLACASAEAEPPPGWALVELPTLALVTPGWLLLLRARGVEVALAPCGGACCQGVAAVQELADRVLALGVAPAAPIRLAEPAATARAVRGLVGEAIVDGASPLGLLRLDEELCTLCSACATACPADALRFDESLDEAVLRFTAAACVGCARCVTACPEHALAVERGIDFERIGLGRVDLVRGARERCSDCGADLPPRPMRRRLRELLPQYAGAPLELCAGCAAKTSRTIESTR